MLRTVLCLVVAVGLCGLCSSSAQAAPQPGAPQPAAPQPPAPQAPAAEAAPESAAVPAAAATATEATSRAPVVHVINARPDEERGIVKLARYVDSSTSHAGDNVIVSVRYQEVCSTPCGVPLDVSERPLLFFIRDGKPISPGFRLPSGAETVTLKVKPSRSGMQIAGLVLTYSLILPVGIPLLIVGRGKVWAANGPPAKGQDFVRLKKART